MGNATPDAKDKTVETPSKSPKEKLLEELSNSIAEESKAFTFACGGTIPVWSEPSVAKPNQDKQKSGPKVTSESEAKQREKTGQNDSIRDEQEPEGKDDSDSDDDTPVFVQSIDLRWDSNDRRRLFSETKLILPLEKETKDNLQLLLKDMQPATFGRGNKDVLDESYRKALKMDTERFLTNFNPYQAGIIDTIAQALLPPLRHNKHGRYVKAELYKLNVGIRGV